MKNFFRRRTKQDRKKAVKRKNKESEGKGGSGDTFFKKVSKNVQF